MRNELAAQIWDRHRNRVKRNRRLAGLGSVGAVVTVAAMVTLWPRPALAFQDVVKATMNFRSISWKQLDEGTIRDLGSTNPKTVKPFSQRIHHYASYDKLDLQQRIEPSSTWKSLRKFKLPVPFKQKDGSIKKLMMPAYAYEPGPSKNLDKSDLYMHLGQFINIKSYFQRGDKQEETEYLGRPAIKFHYREVGKHVETEDTILADPVTKRMIYRRYAVTRVSGERLFLREQSDFVYDGPKPK